jgi:serine/threonine protein kinase
MLTRLEAIHELGIVHRDVKPENFMLKRQIKCFASEIEIARQDYLPEQHRQEIYLVDFGLSKKYVDSNC